MPICQACNKKWTWIQTIKRIFILKCPYCGSKQYESASSRKKGCLFIPFVLLPLPINIWLELSISITIVITVVFALIIFCLYPFFLELSNDKEPII